MILPYYIVGSCRPPDSFKHRSNYACIVHMIEIRVVIVTGFCVDCQGPSVATFLTLATRWFFKLLHGHVQIKQV